jgi:hypothetical protein
MQEALIAEATISAVFIVLVSAKADTENKAAKDAAMTVFIIEPPALYRC